MDIPKAMLEWVLSWVADDRRVLRVHATAEPDTHMCAADLVIEWDPTVLKLSADQVRPGKCWQQHIIADVSDFDAGLLVVSFFGPLSSAVSLDDESPRQLVALKFDRLQPGVTEVSVVKRATKTDSPFGVSKIYWGGPEAYPNMDLLGDFEPVVFQLTD